MKPNGSRSSVTLILLDELPPYLLNANARAAGKGTLTDLFTALPDANLVDAVAEA